MGLEWQPDGSILHRRVMGKQALACALHRPLGVISSYRIGRIVKMGGRSLAGRQVSTHDGHASRHICLCVISYVLFSSSRHRNPLPFIIWQREDPILHSIILHNQASELRPCILQGTAESRVSMRMVTANSDRNHREITNPRFGDPVRVLSTERSWIE